MLARLGDMLHRAGRIGAILLLVYDVALAIERINDGYSSPISSGTMLVALMALALWLSGRAARYVVLGR